MKFLHLVAAVVLLPLIEAVLVILGALPPVMSYSPGNILFSFAKLAVIAYAGMIFAQEGLKKSALNGAILGFAGIAALCVFSLLSSVLFGKTVLGLPPVPNAASLAILLALTLIANAVLGAIMAAIAGVIAIRAKKSNKRK